MTEKRIQFSNIVYNQLPTYVREEFPLVAEFLSEYYRAQEFQGAPIDLIQNIDEYIKVDKITHEQLKKKTCKQSYKSKGRMKSPRSKLLTKRKFKSPTKK